MTLFVDVGGTKTRFWSTGFKKTIRTNLAQLPRLLKRTLRSQKRPFSEIVIGMRGVWSPREKSVWKRKFGRSLPIIVLSDIELAHLLAFKGGPGIILNAGTGSIAFGKNTKGHTARSGGLGPLMGDDGSAFWIGREFLRQTNRNNEKLKKIRSLSKDSQGIRKVAAIATGVLRRAAKRPQSREAAIVRSAINGLRDYVTDVRRQLGGSALPVQVTGGLFENRFFSGLWKKSRSRA